MISKWAYMVSSSPDYRASLKPFPCTRCGLCCQHIDSITELAEYDIGNGCCRYYSNAYGCQIYESRPTVCQIDKGYELFFAGILSHEEYYQHNAKVCNQLQLFHDVSEEFRVKL